MEVIMYKLISEMLCMGERIKRGIFRPTITTIPYTQITGALKSRFSGSEIHAVGYLDNYEKNYLIYSLRNRIECTSKLPLTIEYLKNVRGNIYIMKSKDTEDIFKDKKEFTLFMGALKSKGFGECRLFNKEIIEFPNIRTGKLNTRIPEEILKNFVIKKVISPVYGYLFKPTSETSGVYVRSLVEGSVIVGPEFLLKGE